MTVGILTKSRRFRIYIPTIHANKGATVPCDDYESVTVGLKILDFRRSLQSPRESSTMHAGLAPPAPAERDIIRAVLRACRCDQG